MLLKLTGQDNGSDMEEDSMSAIKSFSLFYLSLTPLWLSIGFIDGMSIWNDNPNIYTEIISIVVMIIVMIVSAIVVAVSFRKSNGSGAQPFILKCIKEEKLITAEYVLTYVLPLFAFDFTVWYGVVLFLLFYFVLAFLHIRHNRLGANIILEIFGFCYYECTLENEDGILIEKNIIARKSLLSKKNYEIIAKPINNEYYFDVTK